MNMRRIITLALLLFALSAGAGAQEMPREFTAEEQAIADLSAAKWDWMSEKNVEKLDSLFHESAQFVHMGGYWGKQQELETIGSGTIWYKKAEVHDVQVRFAAGTATVYSVIHLNSEVGGNSVRYPFIVTEVYVMDDGRWQLSSLAFTRTLGE